MPRSKSLMVDVACPQCGHVQPEPPSAYSTRCKKCQAHYRVQEALHPAAAPAKADIRKRQVVCFQCGTALEAPAAAQSTMCKRCSSHVDLADYQIAHTVSKNFRTHGRLVVEEKGYVLNTDALVGDALLKGKLIGKIKAERTLEIHTGAKIQGTIAGGVLVIPNGHHFHWPEIQVSGTEISGEFVGNLVSNGMITIKSTGRVFGDIRATGLMVEAGGTFVGAARIGGK